ncbi:CDP-diacylglycerol--glycerol-3-phosphate 3-phosphatidyltransferase [Mycoplasma testudineum]|uniref:CDP-diacylglycerol--glycerol-3-phosphate 3-phosphatidyltransferase n=1 Tax=Mycoplasma testudineum TaxID=244584 RepID=A0A4R6IFT8_9MOLU|nr:CDP-diacylglycerol--glycerol-3-phosphate 3-phosphatidyltransferase [Mycoplasma testudineum]TDO19785.1 CDP-diacylglycerol--glycerol-3-phosphate 3-phosphatidyltransferase [Mycoplasma testudineum]
MILKKTNIPNFLTITRLIFVIPVIILFSLLLENKIGTTLALSLNLLFFALAMLTDYVDGLLARKWKVVSTFGKLFDPLADKIMITTTLIFLATLNLTYVFLVVLFIIRDLVVDGSRNLMAAKNISIAASIWGKLKTVFQSAGILIIFVVAIANSELQFSNNLNYDLYIFLINIIIIIAYVFSILSGYLYFKTVLPYLFVKKK